MNSYDYKAAFLTVAAAIVLSDSSDPNKVVLSRDLYEKAMRIIDEEHEFHVRRNSENSA